MVSRDFKTEFGHCLLALLIQMGENQRLKDLERMENSQRRRELEELAAKEMSDTAIMKNRQLEQARDGRRMIENQIAEKYEKKQKEKQVRKYEQSE